MKKTFVAILVGLFLAGVSGRAVAGVTATDVVCTGCVNDTDIAASAVTEPKIIAGAVTNAKIADGAVTDAKISGPISASKLEKPANVIVVATSGGDFTSISAALATISPSAGNPYVIKVMPGIYDESINMKSYVHLEGSGWEVTHIAYLTDYVVKCNNVVDVSISGLTLAGYAGIENVSSAPAIYGNRFKPTYSYGIQNQDATPIIRDNIFEQAPWYAIRNSGNSAPIISDNKISGGGGAGIRNDASASPTIINNVIQNNDIGIENWGQSVIIGNIIEGNGEGISLLSASSSTSIKDNMIKYNNYGIRLSGGANPDISGNTISNNGSGIAVSSGASPKILHNKITANETDLAFSYSGGNVSFNVYDIIVEIDSNVVKNFNIKSDGTPAS